MDAPKTTAADATRTGSFNGTRLTLGDVVPTPPPARLWDASGLAAFLSVTPCAVRGMMRRREIPKDAILRIGRRVRYIPARIHAWVGFTPGMEITPSLTKEEFDLFRPIQ